MNQLKIQWREKKEEKKKIQCKKVISKFDAHLFGKNLLKVTLKFDKRLVLTIYVTEFTTVCVRNYLTRVKPNPTAT